MQNLHEHVGELVVLRCWCGIQHAVPSSLRNEQVRAHNRGHSMLIYCPLGHQHQPAGESEAARLRRQLEREQVAKQRAQDEAAAAERRRRAAVGQTTKLRNRIAKGVCPDCGRTFENLARHMQTKHPEFAATPAQ
jgi:hypothetical protein